MVGCLILHGYTGGPYEVAPLSSYLKKNTNWFIHVPTLPGHGRDLELEDIPYTHWINTAEQALKTLKKQYDEIHVIGFSMGGMIGAYLAAKYHIPKLVLLAPSGKYLSWKQLACDMGKLLADGVQNKLGKNKLFLQYKRKAGMIPFQSNIEFIRLVRFTRKYIRHVQSDVLIAQGYQDGMVPFKTAYYLYEKMMTPNKEVVFFDHSKHLICLGEDKDTLNRLVHQFLLKKVPTATAVDTSF